MADDAQPGGGIKSPGQDFSSFIKSTGMPSADEVEKKLTDLNTKRSEALKPVQEALSDVYKRKQVLLNNAMENMGSIEVPQLEKLPPAPAAELRDPTQSLGSIASVLAVFGSLKTRAPMTSALNSMTASMKGFHAGDKERAVLERQNWQDKFQEGLRNNQELMQKYSMELQKQNYDMEKAQFGMRAIAAEAEDLQMQAALTEKNFQAQTSILNARWQAGTQGANMLMKKYEFDEREKDRRAQLAISGARAKEAAEDHRLRRDELKAQRDRSQANHDLQRADMGTKWMVANAQRQVKPYQETLRKANDIESNLVVGMEMPDTVKAELKTLAGAKGQLSRWSQGLDKYTGDIVTSFFSRIEKGTMGKLSQQDVDAMKAFTGNMKAANAKEIENIKESYRPLQKEYKISEGVFDIPFRAGAPDLGLPGLDTDAAKALGITPGSSSSEVVDGLVGN